VHKTQHLNTFVTGRFTRVSHISCITLHHHNLPADWAR